MNGYHYSLEAADAIRDELKYAIPCRTCGAREPVRVEMIDGIERCSECWDWPRCAVCRRWLTPEEDDAAITINLGLRTGSMCSTCTDRHWQPEPSEEDREP